MPVRVSSSSSGVYLVFSGKGAHKSSVAFVHDLKSEVGTVENVSPGVDNTTVRRQQGLVKVETVAPVTQIYYLWEVDYIFIPVGCWALNPVIKEAKLLR